MDGSGNNASTENLNLLIQWATTCWKLIHYNAMQDVFQVLSSADQFE
jgi:hypothetical protein